MSNARFEGFISQLKPTTEKSSHHRAPHASPQLNRFHSSGSRDIMKTEDFKQFQLGNYDSILKLLRILGTHGRQAKRSADTAIDACGSVHHVKKALFSSFLKLQKEDRSGSTDSELQTNAPTVHLLRYFYLICFAAYLEEMKSKKTRLSFPFLRQNPFVSWLLTNPELVNLKTWIKEQTPSHLFSTFKDHGQPKDHFEMYVHGRKGAICGPGTIIKTDFFDAINQTQLQQKTQGHPNFRTIPSLPLSATAQPTVNGIRHILDTLGASPPVHASNNNQSGSPSTSSLSSSHSSSSGSRTKKASSPSPMSPPLAVSGSPDTNTQQKQIIWTHLREEPVVYIQGEPHTLRDLKRPFTALPEFRTSVTAMKVQICYCL